MLLIEFLIHLLQAQAQTLQRFAAFFGEDELFECLENSAEFLDRTGSSFKVESEWFEISRIEEGPSAYTALEGTVQEFGLPAVLEFHLWAYPFYRTLVESSIDLKAKIRGGNHPAGEILVNEALKQAKNWTNQLSLSPDIHRQIEAISTVPWLRFRSQVLKKIGKNPFSSL